MKYLPKDRPNLCFNTKPDHTLEDLKCLKILKTKGNKMQPINSLFITDSVEEKIGEVKLELDALNLDYKVIDKDHNLITNLEDVIHQLWMAVPEETLDTFIEVLLTKLDRQYIGDADILILKDVTHLTVIKYLHKFYSYSNKKFISNVLSSKASMQLKIMFDNVYKNSKEIKNKESNYFEPSQRVEIPNGVLKPQH